MKRFRIRLVPLLILVLLIIPTINVRADTGPHPTMDFDLVWLIPRGTVKDAALFNCEDSSCSNPVEVGGPFSCSPEGCLYNYGSEGFYKLVIDFDDKTRESNVFEKRGFEAAFVVQVNPSDLFIEQTSFPVPYSLSTQLLGFLVALPVTVVIEIITGYILLKRWNLPRKWFLILVANIITLPIVWFLFPLAGFGTVSVIILSELFAWIIEAAFYQVTMRKDGMKISQALLFSLIANLASVTLPALCFWLFLVIGS